MKAILLPHNMIDNARIVVTRLMIASTTDEKHASDIDGRSLFKKTGVKVHSN